MSYNTVFFWILDRTSSSVITIGSVASEDTTNSNIFSNFLPSPPDKRNKASVSFNSILFDCRKLSCSMALTSNISKSSFPKGFRIYTWQRDKSAGITSKLGFSVVAPIRVTHPFSTAAKRESCCDLLNRWISSIKSIGFFEVKSPPLCFALSIISLTSFTPLLIALKV